MKRTGTTSFLLLLAAFALAAPVGRGQGVIKFPDGTEVVIDEAGEGAVVEGEAPASAPSAGGADTAGVGTDAQRLQKLLAAPFDRRPRAILSTWGGVGIDLPAPPEPEDGPKAEAPKDPFAAEVASLQSNVTNGDWAAVGSYLAALPLGHGAKVHRHICEVLWKAADPRAEDPDAPLPQLRDRPIIRTADVLGLSAAAAPPIEPPTLDLLAALVRCAVAQGDAVDPLVAAWERGDGRLGGAQVTSRVAAAWVLVAAERPREAERFVPTLDATRTDPEGLDLLARFQLGRHADSKRPEPLAAAWQATVALLALPAPPPGLRQAALERALLLAPRVGAALGPAWISASFGQANGAGGRALLAVAGAHLAKLGVKEAREPDKRLEALEAARGPIDALLQQAPDDPAWSPALDLLLRTWLREAEVSLALGGGGSSDRMPQFDDFGNLFFAGRQRNQDPRLPVPISARDLLRLAPSEAWLKRADEGPRRSALAALAGLHLREDHPLEAFPYLERLAPVDRTAARDLAHELLRSWTKAHDLNADRRSNPYRYFYGFEQRADAIPLTRQKQERNLEELAGWVEKLRRLLPAAPGATRPGAAAEGLDEELVAEAFVRTHGQAEVYKLEAIARVFGDPSRCQPKTLARIAQTMRANLATLWRDPKVQESAKTKRRDAEITAEVKRGYEVACKVAADALVAHPGRWDLLLADASLRFDRNEHEHRETQSSASFAPARTDALRGFAAAAAAYAKVVPDLAETEETLEPFELWFHASLGACDLPLVTREDRPDLPEAARVKAAFEALPEPARTRHVERFARSLFQTLGAVKPEVKLGYLRAAFTIVGDHPGAREARDVFDFYADLVREVQLVTRLDGSDRVGHGRPFGLHVALRHTKEIERESGGFAKFLTNQNQAAFSYNYGRPLEDYRDKFQEGVTKALAERFDVVSITFHAPEVVSRGDPEPGWRQTPYCYVVLKPKGPEVDQVPALELSMDFLDTSGYVILPIASAPLPIDARDPQGDARPIAGLTVELTLDERRAKDGILGLEVEARGRGLVPPLDALVDLSGLPAGGFEVAKVEDPGPSATELLDDEQGVALGCERRFVLELRGLTGQTQLPTSFRFPPVRVADAKVTRTRFVDADVVAVDEVVALDATYGARARWPWALGAAALGLLLAVAWLRARRPVAAAAPPRFQLPARATPFAVLELLHRVRASGAVAEADRAALDEAIATLERAHFAPGGSSSAATSDLSAVAGHWVGRAR